MKTKKVKILITFLVVIPFLFVAYLIFFAKNTYVEWIDFIHYNNRNYENADIEIETDLIGDELGEVCEVVPSKINHLTFRMQNGQAGFLKEGTKFYEITGYEAKGYIAVCVEGKYILYKAFGYESPKF